MKRRRRFVLFLFLMAMGVVVGLNRLAVVAIETDAQYSYEKRGASKSITQVDNRRTTYKTIDGSGDSQKCKPSEDVNARLVGELMVEDQLYQMWWYESRDSHSYRRVTTNRSGVCGTTYDEMFEDKITARTPLNISRLLTFQFLREIASDFGGVDSYREHITGGFDSDRHTHDRSAEYGSEEDLNVQVNSVDLWAYRQLGIEFPEGSYTVINIDNAWQYDSQPVDVEL